MPPVIVEFVEEAEGQVRRMQGANAVFTVIDRVNE